MSGERKSPFEGKRFNTAPVGDGLICDPNGFFVPFDEADAVLRQRDELAEELRSLVAWASIEAHPKSIAGGIVQRARAALAKLEAEP